MYTGVIFITNKNLENGEEELALVKQTIILGLAHFLLTMIVWLTINSIFTAMFTGDMYSKF